MKTLAAIATALLLIAGPAFSQTLIGEWQLVKSFCEGGKVLEDFSGRNDRRIFDNASTNRITDLSQINEQWRIKDCALHVQ